MALLATFRRWNL